VLRYVISKKGILGYTCLILPCNQGIIKCPVVRYCFVYFIKAQCETDYGNESMCSCDYNQEVKIPMRNVQMEAFQCPCHSKSWELLLYSGKCLIFEKIENRNVFLKMKFIRNS